MIHDRTNHEELKYTIASYSSYSSIYKPANILKNEPNNICSRWSTNINDSHQFINLKLDEEALVLGITFGKYNKMHVCNVKEMKVYSIHSKPIDFINGYRESEDLTVDPSKMNVNLQISEPKMKLLKNSKISHNLFSFASDDQIINQTFNSREIYKLNFYLTENQKIREDFKEIFHNFEEGVNLHSRKTIKSNNFKPCLYKNETFEIISKFHQSDKDVKFLNNRNKFKRFINTENLKLNAIRGHKKRSNSMIICNFSDVGKTCYRHNQKKIEAFWTYKEKNNRYNFHLSQNLKNEKGLNGTKFETNCNNNNSSSILLIPQKSVFKSFCDDISNNLFSENQPIRPIIKNDKKTESFLFNQNNNFKELEESSDSIFSFNKSNEYKNLSTVSDQNKYSWNNYIEKIESDSTCFNHPKMTISHPNTENNPQLIFHGGLKNDGIPEFIPVKYLNNNRFIITDHIKICPLQSYGVTFNFSLWHVILHGIKRKDILENIKHFNSLYFNTIWIQKVASFLKQQSLFKTFEQLKKETKIHNYLEDILNRLICDRDFQNIENVLIKALEFDLIETDLLGENLHHKMKKIKQKNTWPSIRGGFASVCARNKIYIHGGWRNNVELNDFYEFDCSTETFKELNADKNPRSCHQLIFFGDDTYQQDKSISHQNEPKDHKESINIGLRAINNVNGSIKELNSSNEQQNQSNNRFNNDRHSDALNRIPKIKERYSHSKIQRNNTQNINYIQKIPENQSLKKKVLNKYLVKEVRKGRKGAKSRISIKNFLYQIERNKKTCKRFKKIVNPLCSLHYNYRKKITDKYFKEPQINAIKLIEGNEEPISSVFYDKLNYFNEGLKIKHPSEKIVRFEKLKVPACPYKPFLFQDLRNNEKFYEKYQTERNYSQLEYKNLDYSFKNELIENHNLKEKPIFISRFNNQKKFIDILCQKIDLSKFISGNTQIQNEISNNKKLDRSEIVKHDFFNSILIQNKFPLIDQEKIQNIGTLLLISRDLYSKNQIRTFSCIIIGNILVFKKIWEEIRAKWKKGSYHLLIKKIIVNLLVITRYLFSILFHDLDKKLKHENKVKTLKNSKYINNGIIKKIYNINRNVTKKIENHKILDIKEYKNFQTNIKIYISSGKMINCADKFLLDQNIDIFQKIHSELKNISKINNLSDVNETLHSKNLENLNSDSINTKTSHIMADLNAYLTLNYEKINISNDKNLNKDKKLKEDPFILILGGFIQATDATKMKITKYNLKTEELTNINYKNGPDNMFDNQCFKVDDELLFYGGKIHKNANLTYCRLMKYKNCTFYEKEKPNDLLEGRVGHSIIVIENKDAVNIFNINEFKSKVLKKNLLHINLNRKFFPKRFMLIIGGKRDEIYFNNITFYDFENNVCFKQVPFPFTSASKIIVRSQLVENKVYIMFCYSNSKQNHLNKTDIFSFDPFTLKFTKLIFEGPEKPTARTAHTFLYNKHNNSFYIFGGNQKGPSGNIRLNDMWKFKLNDKKTFQTAKILLTKKIRTIFLNLIKSENSLKGFEFIRNHMEYLYDENDHAFKNLCMSLYNTLPYSIEQARSEILSLIKGNSSDIDEIE